MKIRLLAFVVILGCGAIAIGWVYERSLREPAQKTALVIPDDIDYFLTNMTYRALNSAGTLNFRLQTPRLEHYPHNDVSSLEVPSMRIETDTDPWLVDSKRGEYQHANNLMHLTREVVMQRQGSTPMQVFTESIRFEPDRELVTADSDILMVSPQARINAEYAVFDLAEKVYHFTRARTVYQNEDG